MIVRLHLTIICKDFVRKKSIELQSDDPVTKINFNLKYWSFILQWISASGSFDRWLPCEAHLGRSRSYRWKKIASDWGKTFWAKSKVNSPHWSNMLPNPLNHLLNWQFWGSACEHWDMNVATISKCVPICKNMCYLYKLHIVCFLRLIIHIFHHIWVVQQPSNILNYIV